MKKILLFIIYFVCFSNIYAKQLSGYISCTNNYVVFSAYIPGIDSSTLEDKPCNEVVDIALEKGSIIGISWATMGTSNPVLIYAITIDSKHLDHSIIKPPLNNRGFISVANH